METQRIPHSHPRIGNNPVSSKSLAGPGGPATKSLGGYADPALVQWLEQATAYYNAVMAGDPNTPQPSQEEWNSFLAQLQWAQQQLGQGQTGWDPGMGGMGGMGGPAGPGAQGAQGNEFGGMPGTLDNWVYTQAQSQIGFTGNGTHDIWSNEIILDVFPVSAQVTVEHTTDTRFQPPEEVIKIVVKDPATGTEAVYFVHDFDPAAGDTIEIRTPEASQVRDAAGIAAWGEFVAGSAQGGKPEASIPGVEQPDGSLVYEPEFAGETVDFWAQPGEDQTHHVYADANISVKPSDEVEFRTGLDGQIVVEVTHSDGSKDTYIVKKGYNANVNVNEEYVNGEIPESIRDRVTLNGAADASGGSMDGAAILDALLSATGRTESQLLNALKAAGYGDMTIEEFKDLLSEGKFTQPIDGKLLRFLGLFDPTLAEAIQSTLNHSNGDTESAFKDIQARLVELLSLLDPNSIYGPTGDAGGFMANGEVIPFWICNTGEYAGQLGTDE
ncbi:MAG: hypothetical protein IT573_05160 [Deltaproteobacteria bacterium]|nr:hypothetical protein [Deltaproteobacteria bacterium]